MRELTIAESAQIALAQENDVVYPLHAGSIRSASAKPLFLPGRRLGAVGFVRMPMQRQSECDDAAIDPDPDRGWVNAALHPKEMPSVI